MKYITSTWLLLGLLGACASNQNEPKRNEYYEINSFSDPIVLSVVERVKDDRVLFVFDIDNTLLQYPQHQFVGSDQWYQWQKELPNESTHKVHCVFEMQAIAGRLQSLIATEDGESTEFIRSLQHSGNDVIAMSARGHDVRAATERELERNGFDFSRSLPGGNRGFIGTYRPPSSPLLPSPRDVSYQDGVALLAGQNKGYMIRDLLSRIEADDYYELVIFFDDNPIDTAAVSDWFATYPLAAIVFLYSAVDVDLAQYDLRVADEEKEALLQVFRAFDRNQECEVAR